MLVGGGRREEAGVTLAAKNLVCWLLKHPLNTLYPLSPTLLTDVLSSCLKPSIRLHGSQVQVQTHQLVGAQGSLVPSDLTSLPFCHAPRPASSMCL